MKGGVARHLLYIIVAQIPTTLVGVDVTVRRHRPSSDVGYQAAYQDGHVHTVHGLVHFCLNLYHECQCRPLKIVMSKEVDFPSSWRSD